MIGSIRPLMFKKIVTIFYCPECDRIKSKPYKFVIHKSTWNRVKCLQCGSYVTKKEAEELSETYKIKEK